MKKIKYIIIFVVLFFISFISFKVYISRIGIGGECTYRNTFYGFKFKYDCRSLSMNSYGWDTTKETKETEAYHTFSIKNDYLTMLSYSVLSMDNDKGNCTWKGPLDPPYYTPDTLLCYQVLYNNGQQFIKETALMGFPSGLGMNNNLEFYKQKVETFKERVLEPVLTNEQEIVFYYILGGYSSNEHSTCTFIPNQQNKLVCFKSNLWLGPQLKSILESFKFLRNT